MSKKEPEPKAESEPEVGSSAKEGRVHGDEIIHLKEYVKDIRGLIFDRLPLWDLMKMKRVDPPVPGLDEYIVNKFSVGELYKFKESNPRDPYILNLIVSRLNKCSWELSEIERTYYAQQVGLTFVLSELAGAETPLTHLEMGLVGSSLNESKGLFEMFPHITHLTTSLALFSLLGEASVGEYLNVLKQLESLQSLEIKGFNQLADSDLQIIGTLSKLRSFTLSGLDGKVTNEGLRQLQNLPNLEKLCLVGFRSLDGKVLSEIVSRPQFKSLELILEHSSRDFKLAEALEGTDHLENLGVELFTSMNDTDMDAVLRQTNLRSLIVVGCSAVSKSKFEELKNLSNLEVVSLKSANQFPDNVSEVFEASKFSRIYIYDHERKEIVNKGSLVEFEYRDY